MSTGDGQGHRWKRNGEFCATVGTVARTASISIQSVNQADWAVC